MYRTLFAILLSSLIASSVAQAESGLASFYGGRGGGMTCAHRTRPMGSVVTVTARWAARSSVESTTADHLSAAGSLTYR